MNMTGAVARPRAHKERSMSAGATTTTQENIAATRRKWAERMDRVWRAAWWNK